MEWPTLDEKELQAIPEREKAQFMAWAQEVIEGNKLQLEDLNRNCHSAPQYAKTYRVLRRDKRKTLDSLRSQINQKSAGLSDGFVLGVMTLYDRVISRKLDLMRDHFSRKWNSGIETWAGKEGNFLDRTGCLIVLGVLFTGSSAVLSLFLVVTLIIGH